MKVSVVCPKLTNYSSSNSNAETQRRGGLETRTTTRTKQTCRARLMCFSEVCVPASVLPSWRVHTCFCSLWAPSETVLSCLCCLNSRLLCTIVHPVDDSLTVWTNCPNFGTLDEFDGKHLKVRTPSLVTRLTKETTSCHYWKRKRLKVWATSKNSDSLFSYLFFPPFSPTEGFPHRIIQPWPFSEPFWVRSFIDR